MGFTLILEIEGLCAFVPSQTVPILPEGGLRLDRMRVLVLDAPGGVFQGFSVCPHVPRLVIEPGADQELHLLAGHQISLDTGSLPADQQGLRLDLSFWKVAQMQQVHPSFAVADGFFTDPPARPGLAASLRLSAGSIFGIKQSEQQLTFPSTSYHDNFALGVRIEIPISGASGTFTLTPFDGQGPARVITFRPAAGSTSVTATLINLCDGLAPLDSGDLEGRDSDFVMYYLLDPSFSGEFRIPRPLGGMTRKGEVRGEALDGGTTCIPVQTRGHGGV